MVLLCIGSTKPVQSNNSFVKNLIGKLHKVFESRIRLGIMSVLMVNDWVDFNALKEYLEITDGNLASHMNNLEKHKLIEIKKQFVGRKPNTRYKATAKGKKMFREHLDYLGKFIDSQNT